MSRSKDIGRNVSFTLRAPEAQSAFLAGTFNGWSAEALPMRKDAKGIWSVAVKLEPGRYEYKFVVDGEWCARAADASESGSSDCVANAFGTENRVLEVE
jgi:1,4-alpha-glucan branching enzyme